MSLAPLQGWVPTSLRVRGVGGGQTGGEGEVVGVGQKVEVGGKGGCDSTGVSLGRIGARGWRWLLRVEKARRWG